MDQDQRQPAGLLRRSAAAVVDILLFVIILSLILSVMALLSGADVNIEDRTEDIGANLVLLFLYVVYYLVIEMLSATSPGKWLFGLRIVRTDAKPINGTDIIVRNIIRPVDTFFFCLVGIISIAFSTTNQRLGDRAAGTFVIRVKPSPDDQPTL